MSEKRFVYSIVSSNVVRVIDMETGEHIDDIVGTLNNFNDKRNKLGKAIIELKAENEWLKQSKKDAMQVIKEEFNFANRERQKYLNEPIIAKAYDIIIYVLKKTLDKLRDDKE